MTDEVMRDLVNKHDKSIDMMASSIEHLASAVGTTNRKLEDIIDVIGRQNLLMEKFNNLEVNIKESFNRVHEKIRTTEYIQNSKGCNGLHVMDEKVKVANKRIADIENLIKWLIGTAALAIIGSVMQLILKG